MPITHALVSAKADSGDASLVRPVDWNADHVAVNLDILSTVSFSGFTLNRYGGQGASLRVRSAQGTQAIPTASQLGDFLGFGEVFGHTGSAFASAGGIVFDAAEIWTATNKGSSIDFFINGLAGNEIGFTLLSILPDGRGGNIPGVAIGNRANQDSPGIDFTLGIKDGRPTVGITTVVIEAGAGQSTNDLQKWINSASVQKGNRVTADGAINGTSASATGQTATVGPTNLQLGGVVVTAGVYRVTIYMVVTTAGTSGTLSVSIGWNDGTAARTATNGTNGMPLDIMFGSTDFRQGSTIIRADGVTNITFTFTVTTPIGSPVYAYYVTLERIQ